MGRPALLGSRSRGPQYRGVRRPPHYGNRPWKRTINQNARHKAKTPEGGARLLAGPLLSQHTSSQDTNKMAWHQGRKHPKQEQPMCAQMMQTTTRLVDRCPGGAAWRRPGPNTPLSLVSEIAAISGVRGGHRNRKSQKSLRFRCAKARNLNASPGPEGSFSIARNNRNASLECQRFTTRKCPNRSLFGGFPLRNGPPP